MPVDEAAEFKIELPPFYDKEQFKRSVIVTVMIMKFIVAAVIFFCRAQDFYAFNRFACFAGMLTGLLGLLAVPSVLDILVETKQSSTAFTAYRRYLQTIFHTINWFR